MGHTTTNGHDMLVTGGSNSIVSFWDAEAQPHPSVYSAARSNGELTVSTAFFAI